MAESKKTVPLQQQSLPGSEQEMNPKPVSDDAEYKPTDKLKDKVVLITGGEKGASLPAGCLFLFGHCAAAPLFWPAVDQPGRLCTADRRFPHCIVQKRSVPRRKYAQGIVVPGRHSAGRS